MFNCVKVLQAYFKGLQRKFAPVKHFSACRLLLFNSPFKWPSDFSTQALSGALVSASVPEFYSILLTLA